MLCMEDTLPVHMSVDALDSKALMEILMVQDCFRRQMGGSEVFRCYASVSKSPTGIDQNKSRTSSSPMLICIRCCLLGQGKRHRAVVSHQNLNWTNQNSSARYAVQQCCQMDYVSEQKPQSQTGHDSGKVLNTQSGPLCRLRMPHR